MISVDQLADVPTLGLQYLAGEAGGTRLVTWAHACDLADPWNWVDTGDLVMTTGGGLPKSAAAQRIWIRKVIDGGVSALVIAPSPSAHPLSPALIAEARKHEFPLLAADYALHFVDLARTVIEREIASERERLSGIRRLHDVYLQSVRDHATFDQRLTALQNATGWSLTVRASAAEQAGTDVTVALDADSSRFVAVSAPAGAMIDRALVEHLAGLVALDLEHIGAQQDQQRTIGEKVLRGLLGGSMSLSSVEPQLHQRGFTDAMVMAFWRQSADTTLRDEDIHRSPVLRQCAPLFVREPDGLLGLMPDNAVLLTAISRELSADCVGLSSPLTMNSSAAESARQARLASLRTAQPGALLNRYGTESSHVSVLPQSVDDTRRLIDRTLGPLIAYDRETGSALVLTVRTFLAHDGGWQAAANALNIHRQTLTYRIRRVQELCGYSPTTTPGSAMLWIALTAADNAGFELD